MCIFYVEYKFDIEELFLSYKADTFLTYIYKIKKERQIFMVCSLDDFSLCYINII